MYVWPWLEDLLPRRRPRFSVRTVPLLDDVRAVLWADLPRGSPVICTAEFQYDPIADTLPRVRDQHGDVTASSVLSREAGTIALPSSVEFDPRSVRTPRFRVSWERVASGRRHQLTVPIRPAVSPTESVRREPRRWRRLLILAALLLALGAAAWFARGRAAAQSGPISGDVPLEGIGLVVAVSGGSAEQLVADLAAYGCRAESLALIVSGAWRLHLPGAPAAVNASFPRQVAAGSPFFVRCGESSTAGSVTSPLTSFGDGQYRVGSDIKPGRYRTVADPDSCRWTRLRGFSGEPPLGYDLTTGSVIVDILPTDAGFRSEGCGSWTAQLSRFDRADTTAPFGSGDWIVGADVAPGTWQSNEGGACYWERLKAFTGALTDVIANGNALVQAQVVTIALTDVGFRSVGRDSWTFVD